MSQENNFIPSQSDYKTLTPFRLFVKSNFPFIEATYEALDNYGLYCKIVEYLNNVIENENTVESNVQALYDAFVSLNNYVSDYFDNLDVQEEINNKLDEMATTGVLQEIVSNIFTALDNKINAVATGSPAGTYPTYADLVNSDPDHSRIYVVTADDYWYYYDTTTNRWTAGGLYQANRIDSKDPILDGRNVVKENFPIYNGFAEYSFFDNLETGAIITNVGEHISFNTLDTRVHCNDYLESGTYDFINLDDTNSYRFGYTLTDLDDIVIASSPWITTRNIHFVVPAGQRGYFVFSKTNNTPISINDVNKVFRKATGTIDYQLPTFDNMLPIKIDSYNGTITFPVNSRFLLNKKIFTIASETVITYQNTTTNIFKILYNIENNTISCVPYNTIPDFDGFIVGIFTAYPYRILSINLNGRVLINDHKIESLSVPINSITNVSLINKNESASGINEESGNNTRITLDNYMRGSGKIKVINLDTTNIKYGFHTFVKTDTGYNRTGDSGWVSDSERIFTLETDKYYNLFFAGTASQPITPKYIADNIIIKTIDDNESSKIRPIIPNFASIGHQGFGAGNNGYRGNSRRGFIAAALNGFNELECDLRYTADNVIVLNHDDTITDDSNQTITISQTSYNNLLTHLFSGETICTLDEYFGICKKYGCRSRLDHIDLIYSNSTAIANMINDIRKNAMSNQITLTCNPSIWAELNAEFPSATYLYGSLSSVSDLTESYVQNTIASHKTNTNKVGLALNYQVFNASDAIPIISKFSDIIFEFWTVDNLESYKTLQKYCNGITSNVFTAYDTI